MRVLAIMAVFTLVGSYIPDPFTAQIDGALSYFAGTLWSLNTFVDASVLLACVKIALNYLAGVVVFIMFVWFIRITGGTQK